MNECNSPSVLSPNVWFRIHPGLTAALAKSRGFFLISFFTVTDTIHVFVNSDRITAPE